MTESVRFAVHPDEVVDTVPVMPGNVMPNVSPARTAAEILTVNVIVAPVANAVFGV